MKRQDQLKGCFLIRRQSKYFNERFKHIHRSLYKRYGDRYILYCNRICVADGCFNLTARQQKSLTGRDNSLEAYVPYVGGMTKDGLDAYQDYLDITGHAPRYEALSPILTPFPEDMIKNDNTARNIYESLWHDKEDKKANTY